MGARRSYSILVVFTVIVVLVGVAAVTIGPRLWDQVTYEPPTLARDDGGNVTATCRGEIYEGNRRVATKEDAEALRNTTCVRGDLIIGAERCDPSSAQKNPAAVTLTTLAALRKIEVVTGTLRLQGVGGLTTLEDLERLTTVGGINLCDSGALTTLKLPALRAVGTIGISSRTAVTAVELPVLESVKAFNVSSGARLERFSAGPVVHIGNISIEGDFGVRGREGAHDVPWLAEVTAVDSLTIEHPMGLRNIVAPKLTAVDVLRISRSKDLESISLPALSRLRDLSLRELPALSTFEAPMLAGPVDEIAIDAAPRLGALKTGAITAVTKLEVQNSGLRSLSFLEHATSFSRVVVKNNPGLEELGFKSFVVLGDVAGEISRNPRLAEHGRGKIGQLAAGTKLKVCENESQPPCRWDASVASRLTRPQRKSAVSEINATSLAALKLAPGFSPAADYEIYLRGTRDVAVKFVRGVPVEVLRYDNPFRRASQPIKLPAKVDADDIAVFDAGFDGVALVIKKPSPRGSFVVDVLVARSGEPAKVFADVNVTALAKDPRIPAQGLHGVVVSARDGKPFSIAFRPMPEDMSYPNLPLVLEDRGGVLVPLASLQTAKGTENTSPGPVVP